MGLSTMSPLVTSLMILMIMVINTKAAPNPGTNEAEDGNNADYGGESGVCPNGEIQCCEEWLGQPGTKNCWCSPEGYTSAVFYIDSINGNILLAGGGYETDAQNSTEIVPDDRNQDLDVREGFGLKHERGGH